MTEKEYWLSGPVKNISPWLQPVAHALLQAEREVNKIMQDFPDALLWEKPAGMASVGFHLQHLTGVLDRLFTYSKGELLSTSQLAYLDAETKPNDQPSKLLVNIFSEKIKSSIEHLKTLKDVELLQPRGVGRAQLPSNVLGLLFHAAEHTMRHTGQLLVTTSVVKKS